MSIVFRKLERRSILRQGVEIHSKEIYSKFTVDIVKFVFIFTVVLFKIFGIDSFEVMKIIRALGIGAFVDTEEFPILFGR